VDRGVGEVDGPVHDPEVVGEHDVLPAGGVGDQFRGAGGHVHAVEAAPDVTDVERRVAPFAVERHADGPPGERRHRLRLGLHGVAVHRVDGANHAPVLQPGVESALRVEGHVLRPVAGEHAGRTGEFLIGRERAAHLGDGVGIPLDGVQSRFREVARGQAGQRDAGQEGVSASEVQSEYHTGGRRRVAVWLFCRLEVVGFVFSGGSPCGPRETQPRTAFSLGSEAPALFAEPTAPLSPTRTAV
jgi:hypothetical protein